MLSLWSLVKGSDCKSDPDVAGACLLSMSEEQCTDNIFNFQHTAVWVDSIADTKEECEKFGKVACCFIPRARDPSLPPTAADQHIGLVFVAFETEEGAAACR